MGESILKDIGRYKNRLITLLLDSPEFCEAMLQKKDYTEEDVDKLVYDQVFPYLYVDDTQTEVLPYVCFEVSIPRVDATIKTCQLVICVYCHKDCMKYDKKGYLGTRTDIICDIIERQLRDSDRFGIGKLSLQSVRYFFPQNKFYGHEMVFTTPDFKVKKG